MHRTRRKRLAHLVASLEGRKARVRRCRQLESGNSGSESVSDELISKLLSPVRLAGLTARNRVIRAGAFEGLCPGGIPTDRLVEYHRQLAAGGVGITTLAYCAVSNNGRTFEDQMYMHEEILPGLRKITAAVHAEGGAVAAQMGHCGYFSKNAELTIPRPLGPTGRFNELGVMRGIPFSGSMTKMDIGQTLREFAEAAALLKRAGFDALEIHMGHGYLLSQFLSPLANKRKDEYGGSLHNRLRMPVAVLHAVREAVGEDFPIWAKINLSDGVAGGIEVEDAVQVAQCLESEGIDALQMSGGFTSLSPMYLLRGERPLQHMIGVEKNDFQKVALRLFGSYIIKEYPFEELFFLEQAKVVRDAVQLPLIYLGGVSSAENMRTVMAEGFDFVAMARALIRDPEMIRRIEKGECAYQTDCNYCNKCIATLDTPSGTRCVRDEEDFYTS